MQKEGWQAILDNFKAYAEADKTFEGSKTNKIQKQITPCLWFDTQAEEAVSFYTSLFQNSKTGNISRYGKEGFEVHGKRKERY